MQQRKTGVSEISRSGPLPEVMSRFVELTDSCETGHFAENSRYFSYFITEPNPKFRYHVTCGGVEAWY
jgi:hypothetical protein